MAAKNIMNVLCFNDWGCNTASLCTTDDSFIAAPLFVSDMQKDQLGHWDLNTDFSFFRTDWVVGFEAVLRAAHYWDASVYLLWWIFSVISWEKKQYVRKRVLPQFAPSSLYSKHFLFLRKWLLTNYWVMFATTSEPFFSLFPWQRHDMPGASERGRETNPVFFTAPKCLLSHL